MPTIAPTPPTPIADLLACTDPACHLRRLTAADEPFCRSLFHEHRAAPFAPLDLSEDILRSMLDQQFEAQRIGYARQFPDAEHLIIAHGGVDVGRLILTLQRSPAGPSEADAKPSLPGVTLHLIDILIAAAERRRGIGSEIIEELARAARELGATRFTLSVLQGNDAARRLYERLGFVTIEDGVHVTMIRHLG
jgi:ribosomal protein S18 acetylase RimI-like enzyme